VGIPAKGLTGQAYDGNYSWDIEVYVLPFLIYTYPQVARNLLEFRYRILDKARQRAREVNEQGVLFPYRTIDGEEASAYYAAETELCGLNRVLEAPSSSTGESPVDLEETCHSHGKSATGGLTDGPICLYPWAFLSTSQRKPLAGGH
jgi:hypothetical protein